MTLNSDIRLDFNNMMDVGIGPSGLTRSELDGLKPQLSQIHLGITELGKLGQLPFLELPADEEALKAIQTWSQKVRPRFNRCLVIGIGGSALGPRLLVNALGAGGWPVAICDSLDPHTWKNLEASFDPEGTLLVAISKSGKTLETWAALIHFVEAFRKQLGEKIWEHVAVITDPRSGPLRHLAEEKRIESFEVPQGVGGRYSVLSAVGLVPAALAGVDLEGLLAGARRMEERCRTDDPWMNPALMSAALHYLYEKRRKRNIRIIMSYGDQISDYPPWFAQLWAESLGKKGKEPQGSTPVVSVGPRDQHSQLQLYLDGPEDKVVTLVGLEETDDEIRLPAAPDWTRGLGDGSGLLAGRGAHELLAASRLSTEAALRDRGRPNQTVLLKRLDGFSVGQILMMAELETVYAGQLLSVNPFDQPAVEQIKLHVRGLLSGHVVPSKRRDYMI